MGFFKEFCRKIKIAFCSHPKKEFAFRSRQYSRIFGTEYIFWQDAIIGIECPKCGKLLLRSKKRFNVKYPYPDGPHYRIDEKGEEENEEP